jgi:hypothetical protein
MKKIRILLLSIRSLPFLLIIGALAGTFSVPDPSNASIPGCDNPPPGLISWWAGEGSADDIVGTNHGTMKNGATFAPGIVGQAFSFDGTDDLMQILSPANIPLGNSPRTMMAWIKSSGQNPGNVYQGILGYGTPILGSGQSLFFERRMDARMHLMNLVYGTGIIGEADIEFNKWYFVALTHDGETTKVYVNGILDGSDEMTHSTTLDPATGFLIGSVPFFDSWHANFYGLIDEVAVFDRALGADELFAVYLKKDVCAQPQPCVSSPPGLVSWWAGDGNGNDVQGTNRAVLMNDAAFADGVGGQAFSLDGVDDYIQVPSPVNLPLGNEPRTIDVWFKTPRDLTASTESAIVQYGTANYYQMFGLITSANAPGKLYFYGHGSDLSGTTTIQRDTWYHGAVTYDGSTLRLYVNGQLEGSAPMSLNTVMDGNGLTIGYRHEGSRWEGLIDEVGVFDRALTSEEIVAVYNAGSAGRCKPLCPPPSDLVSWWSGDGHPFDLAGTNNGTMRNEATYTDGKVGKAFSFTGAEDSFAEIANHPGLNPSGAFTIDGWFYIDPAASGNAGEIATLVSKSEGSSGNGWALYFDDRDSSRSMKFILGSNAISQNAILTADWYHVAGVYDPTAIPRAKLYLNGVQVADSGAQTGGPSLNDLNVRIGAMYWTDYYHQGNDRLNGKADEVEFFNRALTPDEIAANYNAGSAGKCRPCTASPGNMVSWWKAESNADDSIGANDGTLMNGAALAPGLMGQAFSFNGVDQYVEVPHSASLDLTGGLTLEAWFKLKTAGYATIFSKSDANGSQSVTSYGLQINPDGAINAALYGTYPADNWVTAGGLVDLNRWYHVALTWDGTIGPTDNVRLYLDGSFVQAWTKSLAPLNATTESLTLGSMKPPTFYGHMDGFIDEAAVFNRALTAEEIAAIYAAGSAGICIPPDTTPGPFAFIDQTNVALNTLIESNVIAVSGINAPGAISITGGEYEINGSGTWTAAAGMVSNGDTVKVRQTSSLNFSTMTDATLTIGEVSDTFSVSTLAADTTPDAFSFIDQSDVPLSAWITSSPIAISGINTASPISITGGQYSIDGGDYTSVSGTVTNGQTVTVRVMSSANWSTMTSAMLTIGDVSDLFSVTTEGRPEYTVGGSVPGGNGTIVCESPVLHGNNSVCAITPETGYLLKSLTDNGTDVTGSVSGSTYTVGTVTANHTVEGSFAKLLLSPKEGTLGTILEIKGAALGIKKGKAVLQSGGVSYALKVLEWNVGGSGVIKGQLTKAIAGGAVCDVVVTPKEPKGVLPVTETGAFAVKKPAVTELVGAPEGKVGTTVTMMGKFLGYKKGKVFLEAGGVRKSCKVLSWPTTPEAGTGTGQIQFVVPKVVSGTYRVLVQNKVGEDSYESFEVTP